MGLAGVKYGILKRRKLIEGSLYIVSHKLGILEGDKILSRMMLWLKGYTEHTIGEFAKHVFDNFMKHNIRNAALEEIEVHRRNKARLVLLTASVNFICKPIFEFLGFDDLICTRMQMIDNMFSGHPQGKICYGPEKLERSIDYLNHHQQSFEKSFFYSDSISDLPMFEAVGNPKAVTPDRKLEKIARKRGWDICVW